MLTTPGGETGTSPPDSPAQAEASQGDRVLDRAIQSGCGLGLIEATAMPESFQKSSFDPSQLFPLILMCSDCSNCRQHARERETERTTKYYVAGRDISSKGKQGAVTENMYPNRFGI